MMLWESFGIALRSLRANKMRSFLTMLGIIIGVASVITMVAVGAGSVLAGAVASCSPEAPAAPAAGTAAPAAGTAAGGEDIRVVGIFPVSGFIAADGKEMRNGVVMAARSPYLRAKQRARPYRIDENVGESFDVGGVAD